MTTTAKWQSYGLGRWRRQLAPVVVWLAASATAGWLFTHRAQRCELTGIAQGQQRQVASLIDGRLLIVPVRQFEHVKQGQTLAVLEDARVRAELATAAAEVARWRAELAATEDRLAAEALVQEVEQMAEARRFAIDLEDTRLRVLELTVELETDRITLEFLRFQAEWLGDLYEKRVASQYEFTSAQSEFEATKKKVEENENALAQVELDLENAHRRQESFARHHPVPPTLDKALQPLRAALTVQERRIDELALERAMLVLSSPMDGIVSTVLRGAGETLLAGEQVLTVAAAQPAEVIAYATATQAARLEAGMPTELEVTRAGSPRRVADSHVVAIGPAVEQLPVRLWQNPAVPEWGWPIKIAIAPQLGARFGELVGVRVP
ncbi:MAG: HlyD family efflux transporter periplasmic adaptor subunit [Planctomycetota bacterium]